MLADPEYAHHVPCEQTVYSTPPEPNCLNVIVHLEWYLVK